MATKTPTVTTDRSRVLKIAVPDAQKFTADADVTSAVDLDDYMKGVLPTRFGLRVYRSAGTNATIDVALQGSLDNNYWTDLVTVTTPNSENGPSINYAGTSVDVTKVPWRYFRILCTTVGTDNNLEAYAYVGVE